jgi:deoxycytidylate deaminase
VRIETVGIFSSEFAIMAWNLKDVSRCKGRQVAAVVFKEGLVAGVGLNDAPSVPERCPREGMGTGVGYEICREVCKQKYHAEEDALFDATRRAARKLMKVDLEGAEMYVAGHYYICHACRTKMGAMGIAKAFIVAPASSQAHLKHADRISEP